MAVNISDFTISKEKIYLKDENDNIIAYVDFPEFEEGKVEVTHTVVDPSLRGQGVAGILMELLAKELKKRNAKAELTCSYAVKWFNKHKEFSDCLIDPDAEEKKALDMAGNEACGIPKHRK